MPLNPLWDDAAAAFARANPSPEAQAQQRGYLAQVPVGVVRGLGRAVERIPRALSAIPGVRELGTERLANAIEGSLPLSSGGYLEQGVESATDAAATGVLGYGALAAAGALAVPAVGASAAALRAAQSANALRLGGLGFAQYTGAELADSRQRLEKMNEALVSAGQTPLTRGEIYQIATTRALFEGGGEALSQWLIGGRLLKGQMAQAVEAGILKRLPGVLGRGAREIGFVAAEEVPVELGQAAGQSAVERGVLGEERTRALEQAGQPVAPPPGTAAGQALVPTLISSALLGGVGAATARPMPSSGTGTTNAATVTPTAPPAVPAKKVPLPFFPATRATDVIDPLTGTGASSSNQAPPPVGSSPVINPLTGEQGGLAEQTPAVTAPTPVLPGPTPVALPFRPAEPAPVNPLTGEGLLGVPAPAAPTGAGIQVNPLTGEFVSQETAAQSSPPQPPVVPPVLSSPEVPPPGTGFSAADQHAQAFAARQAAQQRPAASIDDGTPSPAGVTPPVDSAPAQSSTVAEPEAALAPVGQKDIIEDFPRASIKTDTSRFQYKQRHAASGATGSLAGSRRYNPLLAGVLDVWLDPGDGETYVVNGHNRLAEAEKAGVATMKVRYLQASTAEQARSLGATINIAEGNGTPLDAAKFLRENPDAPEALAEAGVSLTGAVARQGLALSRLAPSLFGAVARGEFSEARGVIIGELVPDHTTQLALLRLLETQERGGRRLNEETVRELAGMAMHAPTQTQTQETLFGADTQTQSLAVEKASLMAAMRKRLVGAKRLHGLVGQASAAQELGRTGSVINVEGSQAEAQQAAEFLALFDRLKYLSGPINQAFDAAVRRIAGGENATKVRNDLYADLERAIPAALQGGDAGGGAGNRESASGEGRVSEQPAEPNLFGGEQPSAPIPEQPSNPAADAAEAAAVPGAEAAEQQLAPSPRTRAEVEAAFVREKSQPGQGSFEGQSIASEAKSIGQVFQRLRGKGWQTLQDLSPRARASSDRTQGVVRALQFLRSQGAAQLAWDRDGTPHHARDGVDLPAWLTTTDDEAAMAQLPFRQREGGQLQVLQANADAGKGPVTLAEVKRLFRGQQVIETADGTIQVSMPVQGHTLEILNVSRITPTQAELELSIGQSELGPTQSVRGRETALGQGLFRIEVTPERTASTLFHEGEHFFEDSGLLTEKDIATLNHTLLRQGQEPTAENRADLLADRLNANTKDILASPLMRVIRKAQQFLGRLLRLAGMRTTGQLVRSVENGAIFQREGSLGNAQQRRGLLQVVPPDRYAVEIARLQNTAKILETSIARQEAKAWGLRPPADRALAQRAELAKTLRSIQVLEAQRNGTSVEDIPQLSPMPTSIKELRAQQEAETPQTLEGLRALTERNRYGFGPGDSPETRPPIGRLQVVTDQAQPELPGLEQPAASLPVATGAQVPPATPRRGATYGTELKSLLAYNSFSAAFSPNQIAYLQQQNDAGHAFFQKPFISTKVNDANAQALLEEWRQDPRKRDRFLRRLSAPESASVPRGTSEAQARALDASSQEEWKLAYLATQAGLFSAEDFAAFEAKWELPNSVSRYAVNALSSAARIMRFSQDQPTGLSVYQKKHDELSELLRSGKISPEALAKFKAELAAAFQANDITAMQNLPITPPTLRNYYWELAYSWLYNVGTWNTNLWSSTGFQLFHQGIVEPLAGGLDKVFSRVNERPQQVYSDVALRAFTETIKGMPRTMQHFWWLWRRKPEAAQIAPFHRRDTATQRDLTENLGAWERATDSQGQPIQWMRKVAPVVTATSRALEAMDVAMRENVFDARMRALSEQASQQALGRHDETWMRDWQQRQVGEQTPVFQAALDQSKYLTFHDQTGPLGKLLIGGRSAPGPLGFIWQTLFPFANTPDRLLARGLELLPVAGIVPWLARNAKSSTNLKWAGWLPYIGKEALTPEASLVFAKQMVGTMMVAALYGAWAQGLITGGAPDDPAEREAMYRRGEVPNSLRVGDTWYSWRKFEPMSLPLSIAVSAFTAMDRLYAKRERTGEVSTSWVSDGMSLAAVAAQAMVTNVLESSYFAGAAQFLESTQRGRESGDIPKGVIRQLATMVTPWSSLHRSLIRGIDSLGEVPGTVAGQNSVRQPEGVLEHLMMLSVPGVYSGYGAPMRLDLFGRPQGAVTSLLGELTPGVPPVQRGRATDDPVELAFQRLRYFPGNMAKSDETGKTYPREQYQQMMTTRGELVRTKVEQIVNSTAFERLTPADQRKRLQNAFSQAGAQAKRQVLAETR